MTSCSVSSWSILRFQATNIDFADDQGAFSCIIHERLLCLFIVCETMFNIGESRTIFANDTSTTCGSKSSPRKISTETPLERERRLQIHREQRRRSRQQEIEEQREPTSFPGSLSHPNEVAERTSLSSADLAQRRQHRQQETEEQRNRRLEYEMHYDRFTLWKTQIY